MANGEPGLGRTLSIFPHEIGSSHLPGSSQWMGVIPSDGQSTNITHRQQLRLAAQLTSAAQLHSAAFHYSGRLMGFRFARPLLVQRDRKRVSSRAVCLFHVVEIMSFNVRWPNMTSNPVQLSTIVYSRAIQLRFAGGTSSCCTNWKDHIPLLEKFQAKRHEYFWMRSPSFEFFRSIKRRYSRFNYGELLWWILVGMCNIELFKGVILFYRQRE